MTDKSGRVCRLCMDLAGTARGGLENKATRHRDLQKGISKPVGFWESSPCSGKNMCKCLEGGVYLVFSLTSVYLPSPYSATHLHTDKLFFVFFFSLGVLVVSISRPYQCYLTVASKRQKSYFLLWHQA